MKLSFALAGALLAANLFAQNVQPPHTSLKVGDMAPDFTLPATTPQRANVKLSDFRGKSNVVLAFFTAAFTGG
ncbi:MAG: redoxin domain-containing protein [Acidobacteriia bacterium]|nr:redoxin domain-containing protein [Terriglobia bacterium]